MKYIFSIFIALFSLNIAFAEGIDFFHGTWEEAKTFAKEERKLIFVDAYTTWCGPCKKMARDIFPQKSVGDFYNQNFVNVKLDMEKGEGPTFARKYGVRAYPTLLFIDGEGELIHLSKGAKPADKLIQLGEMALRKNNKSEDYAKLYEEGKRDPDFIYHYIIELNKAKKPSLKIANEYIKTQDDLDTEFNIKFLFEALTESDSRIFNLVIDRKKKVIEIFGQEAFDKKIIEVTNVTVNKAVEYESLTLLEESKKKINEISDKDRAKLFHLRADKKYYLFTGDVKNYLKSAKKYVKEYAINDAGKLNELAREMKQYLPTEEKVLKEAEKHAAAACKLEASASHYYTYADLLYTNNKADKALEVAQKALVAANGNPGDLNLINQLIQKIELLKG